jgi:hypothetical protein
MLHRLTGLVLLGTALGAAGCAPPPPSVRGPQKLLERYESLLLDWTRSANVFDMEDRILLVHATYFSAELRRAFAEQYLEVFSIDPGRADSDLEKIATSVGAVHEFFVFADMSNFRWNKLEARDSVWRLGLWGASEQPGVPPGSIVPFAGRGPNLKAFFPYLNDFGRSYLVTFPKQQPDGQPVLLPTEGELTLKLASAFGTASLAWKVRE